MLFKTKRLRYLLFLLFISCNSKVYQYHSGKTHIESSEPIQTTAVLEMEQRLQMDDFYEPECDTISKITFIGIGCEVIQDGNTVTISKPEPRLYMHPVREYLIPNLSGADSLSLRESTYLLHRFDPAPCDHFFVKQSITIEDTALIDQDWEWMPCICIHCKEITICK